LEKQPLVPYLNGRDFMQSSRNIKVIDLFGLNVEEVKQKYPKSFQWILERVKPQRDIAILFEL
jgi:hypothetical protein